MPSRRGRSWCGRARATTGARWRRFWCADAAIRRAAPPTRPLSGCSGRSARYPTTARPWRKSTPGCSPPCSAICRGPAERLPTDWIAGQIASLDRTEGEIDTLMARIAHVRTWTYIAHRGDWVDDGTAWQARARAIEDRLSDALHERLTQRFVDRRAALLNRARDKPSARRDSVDGGRHGAGRRGDRRAAGRACASSPTVRRARSPNAKRWPGRAGLLRRRLRTTSPPELAAESGRCVHAPETTARSSGAARPSPGSRRGGILEPRVALRADEGLGKDSAMARAPGARSAGSPPIWKPGSRRSSRSATPGSRGRRGGSPYQLVEALGSLPRRSVRSLLADLDSETNGACARWACGSAWRRSIFRR